MTRERHSCLCRALGIVRPARTRPPPPPPQSEQRRDALVPCVCWQIGNKHAVRTEHAAALSSRPVCWPPAGGPPPRPHSAGKTLVGRRGEKWSRWRSSGTASRSSVARFSIWKLMNQQVWNIPFHDSQHWTDEGEGEDGGLRLSIYINEVAFGKEAWRRGLSKDKDTRSKKWLQMNNRPLFCWKLKHLLIQHLLWCFCRKRNVLFLFAKVNRYLLMSFPLVVSLSLIQVLAKSARRMNESSLAAPRNPSGPEFWPQPLCHKSAYTVVILSFITGMAWDTAQPDIYNNGWIKSKNPPAWPV